MDIHVINTDFSKPPVQLFVNLCLTEQAPCVPFLIHGPEGFIAQVWGRSSANCGVVIYFSMNTDGETVNLWEADLDGEPTYTFPLNEMAEFMATWVLEG